MSAEPLLYSRRLAAEALSISIRSLSYLIANNELRTVAIASKNMIPAAELKKFAKRGLKTSVTGE